MGGLPFGDTAADARFRERAMREAPLTIMFGAAAVAAACGAGWTATVGPWPWIASLVVIGLPHGAADFAVSRHAWRGPVLVTVSLWYLAAMAIVATCFLAAPAATIGCFAAASCWHFGVAHLDTDGSVRHLGMRTTRALARGCGVLAVPLVAWPAATAAAATELAAFAASPAAAAGLFPTPAVVAAGVCLAAIGGVAVVAEACVEWSRRDGPARVRRLLVELAAIVALGWFAHPLFSVGVYFVVWHAWRQMEPLAESLAGPPLRSWNAVGAALVRVHVAALPLLLPSLVAIGAAWWAWAPDHTLRALAITSIGAYLIVTPAHELLGELLRAPAVRHPRARAIRHPSVRHAGI